jgi:hypothetical protein
MGLAQFVERWLASNKMRQKDLVARSKGRLHAVDVTRLLGGVRPTQPKLRLFAETMEVPYNELAVLAGYIDPADLPDPADPAARDLARLFRGRPDQRERLARFRETMGQDAYEELLSLLFDAASQSIDNVMDTAERFSRHSS